MGFAVGASPCIMKFKAHGASLTLPHRSALGWGFNVKLQIGPICSARRSHWEIQLQKCWLGKMSIFEANLRGLNKGTCSGKLSLSSSLGDRYLTKQCDSIGRQGEEVSKRSPDMMHMVTWSFASSNPAWDNLSPFEAKDRAMLSHKTEKDGKCLRWTIIRSQSRVTKLTKETLSDLNWRRKSW